MHEKSQTRKPRFGRRRRQFVFFCCLLAFPILQFCVFYIGVNLNSILLTFRIWDVESGYRWVGFDNIVRVWKQLVTTPTLKYAVRNSLLSWAIGLFVGTTFALLFSFFIYKKMPLHGVFRVTLFLPQILSAVVMVLLFKYFTEDAVPAIWLRMTGQSITGLMSTSKTSLPMLLFYSVWVGFGTQVLMYTGAMSGISESVVESARLDGITPVKEFLHITLPLIWPTFVTFVVIGIAGLFTNQLNLYSFYGNYADAKNYTLGYYLYRGTVIARSQAEYSPLAALGLLLTLFSLPVTLLVKWLLERFGPRTE